jgi:uncharacterized repeat protein (TIGR03843 family)
MPAHELTATPGRVAFLACAEVEIEGRLPWSSNATFLTTLTCDGARHRAIYKPVRGERPLWDFEPGLHRRERAAFVLSEALGWGVVPPTVIRADAPLGEGSLQWWVDADHGEHYFTIHAQRPDLHDRLRAICAFDLLANNTDRKSGHCLLDGDIATGTNVWAIDNALCFSAESKLRTVIWEFGGEPVPDELLDDVAGLAGAVPAELTDLLDTEEVAALQARAARLAAARRFPHDAGHRYPWPLI